MRAAVVAATAAAAASVARPFVASSSAPAAPRATFRAGVSVSTPPFWGFSVPAHAFHAPLAYINATTARHKTIPTETPLVYLNADSLCWKLRGTTIKKASTIQSHRSSHISEAEEVRACCLNSLTTSGRRSPTITRYEMATPKHLIATARSTRKV